eukprot:1564425-Rhodomonas_salina.2
MPVVPIYPVRVVPIYPDVRVSVVVLVVQSRWSSACIGASGTTEPARQYCTRVPQLQAALACPCCARVPQLAWDARRMSRGGGALTDHGRATR